VTAEQIENNGVQQPAFVSDVNSEPDSLLLAFVNGANQSGLEIGLTLHVSGMVVSGTLISFGTYLDSMGGYMRHIGAGPGSQTSLTAFAAMFDQLSDQFKTAMAESGASEPDPADLPDGQPRELYIHLRDALVFAPGVPSAVPRTLWRGRLSHVSGWFIGSLSVS
jgi:hypothetical protein